MSFQKIKESNNAHYRERHLVLLPGGILGMATLARGFGPLLYLNRGNPVGARVLQHFRACSRAVRHDVAVEQS